MYVLAQVRDAIVLDVITEQEMNPEPICVTT